MSTIHKFYFIHYRLVSVTFRLLPLHHSLCRTGKKPGFIWLTEEKQRLVKALKVESFTAIVKAVNYYCETLYLQCLRWSQLLLWSIYHHLQPSLHLLIYLRMRLPVIFEFFWMSCQIRNLFSKCSLQHSIVFQNCKNIL